MNSELVRLMRQAREQSGLKQEEVGEKLGVKNKTISSWENGRSEPDMDEFIEYCQVVNADYVELLTKAYGDPTEATQPVNITADE